VEGCAIQFSDGFCTESITSTSTAISEVVEKTKLDRSPRIQSCEIADTFTDQVSSVEWENRESCHFHVLKSLRFQHDLFRL